MKDGKAGIKIELPDRDPESHKGENGKVLVIGGSVDYSGAPALAAQAALRSGCDLVKILTSEEVKDVVDGYSESLIVRDHEGDYLGQESVEKSLRLMRWADVAVIGPGLGDPDPEAVARIVRQSDIPMVIDADAIEPSLEEASNSVFTPHRGESEAVESKYGSLEDFVQETGNTVVETDHIDRIVSREGITEIEAGSPAMTVGGTGDVLTGVVASLISQRFFRAEACLKGAKLVGRSGESVAEKYGMGALPEDIIEQIPKQISQ